LHFFVIRRLPWAESPRLPLIRSVPRLDPLIHRQLFGRKGMFLGVVRFCFLEGTVPPPFQFLTPFLHDPYTLLLAFCFLFFQGSLANFVTLTSDCSTLLSDHCVSWGLLLNLFEVLLSCSPRVWDSASPFPLPTFPALRVVELRNLSPPPFSSYFSPGDFPFFRVFFFSQLAFLNPERPRSAPIRADCLFTCRDQSGRFYFSLLLFLRYIFRSRQHPGPLGNGTR